VKPPRSLSFHLGVFWSAVRAWQGDDMHRSGASLAYSTLFAIAPMLIVAVAIAGFVFDEASVRARVTREIYDLVGADGARAVEILLQGAEQRSGGIFTGILGGATFLLAATGAFHELKRALNQIWRVERKPGVDILGFFVNRTLSFALVIVVGFLLLVSLVISASLAALSDWMTTAWEINPTFWWVVNVVVSGGVITVMFALLFRFLPDVELRWRDVWKGAVGTAFFFTVGKELIGFYLGQSAIASSYGAAGSVIVLLLWVYYSSQIVLFGAELTRAYSVRDSAAAKTVTSPE
jgi:membrane protein